MSGFYASTAYDSRRDGLPPDARASEGAWREELGVDDAREREALEGARAAVLGEPALNDTTPSKPVARESA